MNMKNASLDRFTVCLEKGLLPGGKMLATASVTGEPAALQRLADALRALKGVTYGAFSIIAPI